MLRAPLAAVSLALFASLTAAGTAQAAAPSDAEYCRIVSKSSQGASVEIFSIPQPMTEQSCRADGGTVTTTPPNVGTAVPDGTVTAPSLLSMFKAGPAALAAFAASVGETARALFTM
ncbi:hypothetical protein [Streptomyces sp. NPDC050264]|uniref:hypothetical protein n=1 Tax=Streptomyces sp. NPDC050264 TaxID=3155038 RepID=UPI0034471B29